jgi:acyl-CoA dehydrogenase
MGEWQGEQVLGMRLTWNKRYITLAPIATVLGLAFKLSDPEKLLGGEEDLGITCALIPTSPRALKLVVVTSR